MVKKEHTLKAPVKPRFTVVTVSTSRHRELKKGSRCEDPSGDLTQSYLERSGLALNSRKVVPDDEEALREAILKAVYKEGSDLVVLVGGTGIAKKDLTIEAVSPLFDKTLTAFSSLFTMMSYAESGSDVLISRATAGIIGKSIVFCLPGATKAIQLAMEKIVVPQVSHILHHTNE